MEIAEFLLARIAEDEAFLHADDREPHARHLNDLIGTYNPDCPTCRGLMTRGKARLAADCEAKRRIVEWGHKVPLPYERQQLWGLLALPYADHKDFRPEWTPLSASL